MWKSKTQVGGRCSRHREYILKLSQHFQIIQEIEVMKPVIVYQTLADSIKSLVEREDGKGQDTFDMSTCDDKGVFSPMMMTNTETQVTDDDDEYRNTSSLRCA